MSQKPHFTARAAAADITDGLDAGRYVAQVAGSTIGRDVLYATAAAAPEDEDDFFRAAQGEEFTFCVAADSLPVWVRIASGLLFQVGNSNLEIAVAVAAVDD